MRKSPLGGNAVGKIIVFTVANITVGTLELLAPKVLTSLKTRGLDAKKLTNLRYYIKTAISRLIDQGLIEIRNSNTGKKYLALTDKGKERFLKYQLRELEIKKPKRWDGNWRIIAFDVKEKRRHLRYLLRRELTNLGFKRLQDSVWVYPYDCEEVALLVKTGLGLGREVLYMEADYLENDKWLKKEFGLS